MLNILEFNSSLYSALEKQKRDSDLVQNYSREIRHSDSGFESECRNKLIEWEKIKPEGKDGLIAMLAEVNKYLRKANKNNIDKDVIKQILSFRNELSAKAEGKGSLEHGGKWKDHDYLYIDTNGNYVYAKDIAKKKGATQSQASTPSPAKTGIAKFEIRNTSSNNSASTDSKGAETLAQKNKQDHKAKEAEEEKKQMAKQESIQKEEARRILSSINSSKKENAIRKGIGRTKYETAKNAEKVANEKKAEEAKKEVEKLQTQNEPTKFESFLGALGKTVDYAAKKKFRGLGHSDEEEGYKGLSEEDFHKYLGR